MKVDLVIHPKLTHNLISLINEKHGILNVFNDGERSASEMIEYLCQNSWVVTFSEEVLQAVAVLEWIGHRVVSVHLVIFNRVDIRKGWGKLKEVINEYVDEIHAFVPLHRTDVLSISKKLGFKFTKEKDCYHGKDR